MNDGTADAVAARGDAARDEVLEELWTLREMGRATDIERLGREIHAGASPRWAAVVGALEQDGLIRSRPDGTLDLTPAGRGLARTLVRRHRLVEVLFHEVLELELEPAEAVACGVEHVLSPSAEAAVCSFLGHPQVCPHGRPIPPGPCCARRRAVRPLLRRLSELEPGSGGTVALIAPREGALIDQLADLGLVPGTFVRLLQRHPSVVAEIDATQLGLDDAIAHGIWVRRPPDDGA